MNLHSSISQPGHIDFQKQKLGKILSEGLLAGLPLLISLLTIVVDAVNTVSVRFLVSLLFICSMGLLIKRMREGVLLARLASVVFVAGFVFWYSHPAFVSLFLPNYPLDRDVYQFIDDEIIIWSIAYLSLFLLSGVMASHLFFSSSPVRTMRGSHRSNTSAKSIIQLSLSGCLLGIIPYILLGRNFATVLDSVLQSRAIEKPWFGTGNLGDVISSFTYITSSAMVAGASLLWSVTQDRRVLAPVRLLIGIIGLFITAIIYFDHGTRSLLALTVIPPVLVYLNMVRQRSRLRVLVMVLLVAAISIPVLQFQAIYRAAFSRPNLSELLFENWFTLGGSIDFFKETLFAVRIVPAYHDYFRESAIVHFIVSPIPRFIWPGKPVSQVVWFYTLLRWNIDIYTQAGNTFPGIVGQYYMSWGWLGPVIIGVLLGWLTTRLDAWLSGLEFDNDPYVSALGIMAIVWIFLSYRVLSPGFLYPVIGSALIVFFSRKVTRKRPRVSEEAMNICGTIMNTLR